MWTGVMRSALLAIAAFTALAMPAIVPVRAADKPASAAPPELEEDKQDRETRRVCAVALCSTLHNHKPATGQVTCAVHKTWRKEVVDKILARGKVSWPWGDTRCSADLKVDRATLIKAMQEPEYEAKFDKYELRCRLDKQKQDTDVKIDLQPVVTFKQGKAVKANLNWGKIDAPTLAKSALWSITAADNTFGVLQSIAVDDINEFVQTKCMEVKEEWQGK